MYKIRLDPSNDKMFFFQRLHVFLMEQRLTYLDKIGGSRVKDRDVKY